MTLPIHSRHSLRTRLVFATIAILLAGIWSLAFYVSQMLRNDMEHLLGAQQFSAVSMVAKQVENEFEERLKKLELVSLLASEAMSKGPTNVQALLEQRWDLHAFFNGGSYVVDSSGTAIADFPRSSQRLGVNYVDRDYIFAPLSDGRSIIGIPVIGKKARAPVIAMGVPIRNSKGKVVGAIAGVINLAWPNFLDQISQSRHGKTGGFLVVVPQQRLIATASDKTQIMEILPAPGLNSLVDRFIEGYEGTQVGVNPQGVEVLASAKGAKQTGWYVVISMPLVEAFAPIHDMQQRMLQATVVFTLLAWFLIWWVLKKQLSPLLFTAKTLAGMADNNQPLRALPIARDDEVGALVGGFNRLLNILMQRTQALQESETNLAITLQSIGDAVIATDVNGRVSRMNTAAERLTGWTLDEARGAPLYEVFRIIDPETRLPIHQTRQNGMERGDNINLSDHILLLSRTGQEYSIDDSAAPICAASGEILGLVIVFSDVSEHCRMEQALREGNETLMSILETTKDGFWRINLHGRLLDVNPAYCRLSGYSRDELLEMQVSDLVSGANEAEIAKLREFVINNRNDQFESMHRRKDGSVWNVEVSTSYRNANDGEIFVFMRDISERKHVEEKLYLAASVFSHAREAIMITDLDGSIIEVNDSFARITGFGHEEVVGKNPRLLSSGRQEKEFYIAMWQALNEKGHWYGEIWNRRKDGEIFAAMQTVSTVYDVHGKARQFVSMFLDITALKEHERKLEHIAHFDALTTLPNRVLLADRLHQAMAQAHRRGQRLAVVYLDLDGFKGVNDTHGHETGDKLLIALSSLMKRALREGDTLARMGGDEFIAVLLDLGDVSTSTPMLDRLLAATNESVRVDGHVFKVSASLGVTFYPQADEVDADQLLRQADQSMYQAKLAGKNRYHFFDAEQDRSVRGHHDSLEHIRTALRDRQFVLHYQPKVNMRTGEVIGAEALIRWQHPERGLVPPAVFLPVIENHQLAIDIGEWVIDTALTQIELWRSAGLNLPVSVNVGARQLLHTDFVGRLRDILASHPSVKPGDLEMEVLETSALEDLDRVSTLIEHCQELGVKFALDDFGTGYSSLTYLKRLSVNQLKIDQSFVRDMLDDPDDLSILGGVLSLATAFRRQVIAEGVETVAHGTMLLQLGCELAQGYGIARPMAAAEVPLWVKAWRPDTAWSNLPPTSRDNLPLLFAIVEHRAWIHALEEFFKGERDSLPLVHHQCRFSAWLNDEGRALYAGQADFVSVDTLHHRLHKFAVELCDLKAHAQGALALKKLSELHALRDELSEQLQMLVQETR